MVDLDNSAGHRARFAEIRCGRVNDAEAAETHVGGGDGLLNGAIQCALVEQNAHVPDGGLLIEAGFGAGRLAHVLADRQIRYLGTEVVPELVGVAAARVERPDWTFLAVDGPEIPAPDAAADTVASFGVISNMDTANAYRLFREVARVLKPGGGFIGSYCDIRYKFDRLKLYAGQMDQRHDPLGFMDDRFMQAFGDDLGFTVEYVGRPGAVSLNHRLPDGRFVAGPVETPVNLFVMRRAGAR